MESAFVCHAAVTILPMGKHPSSCPGSWPSVRSAGRTIEVRFPRPLALLSFAAADWAARKWSWRNRDSEDLCLEAAEAIETRLGLATPADPIQW